ncbi:hypothetical protein BDB00DRAFT_863484 [Zychaea mexicana]|uniref:uncharacterized protein n=1 Tax=Zychaea mexicana TaxID=64656 RepID=UPI0022FE96CF|nr:uncharacterized protein BDB00DRAFT_863484 [Zychaea mexicana]KAI9468684.1 hypothetical protein BDB00DRAFT_863484 [Zychaea mexicana]
MQDIQFNNYVKYDRFETPESESSKRKKATRACFHCQKAHLTCDDSRPCQRCVKRGLAPTCTDAVRKRAKYLQENAADSNSSSSNNDNNTSSSTSSSAPTTDNLFTTSSFSVDAMGDQQQQPQQQDQQQQQQSMGFVDANQFLNFSLGDLGFGSESAGLEYGFIGNMLQNPLDPSSLNDANPPSAAMNLANSTTALLPSNGNDYATSANLFALSNGQQTTTSYLAPQGLSLFPMSATVAFAPGANPLANTQLPSQEQQQQTPPPISTSPAIAASPLTTTTTTTGSNNNKNNSNSSSTINNSNKNSKKHVVRNNNTSNSGSSSDSEQRPSPQRFAPMKQQKSPNNLTITSTPVASTASSSPPAVSPSSSPSAPKRHNASISSTGSNGIVPRRKLNTPETVYLGVRRPFNYAEGFHYLIEYVKERMSREDLMRISRALAVFRPSFLALIMNLNEEDLVFMEKCIQRTLLEYEKLISFSGTPTVVWRRTGEVCLVGKEFLLLTQWPRDTLLSKKTYIYEVITDTRREWIHVSGQKRKKDG